MRGRDGDDDRDHGNDHGRGRDHDRGDRDERDEIDRLERRLLVDASVLITLAAIDELPLLEATAGDVVVPRTVGNEVTGDPARSALERAVDDGWLHLERVDESSEDSHEEAAAHIGADDPSDGYAGDVALLAIALASEGAVVVSDDKPLRRTCKALSIPLSGSIGVLVRAVERGDLSGDEAKAELLAMDEVGARLSATLLRRAEALIEDATRHERGGWD